MMVVPKASNQQLAPLAWLAVGAAVLAPPGAKKEKKAPAQRGARPDRVASAPCPLGSKRVSLTDLGIWIDVFFLTIIIKPHSDPRHPRPGDFPAEREPSL